MIILMGLPGAGKGTQGQLLVAEQGMQLISMGDLVRAHITGERREQMLAGKLLDDTEIITLLDQALQAAVDEHKVILDGFPRTVPQAEWLVAQTQAGRFTLDAIIYLTVSTEAVKKRLLARGRQDDTEAVIEARFKEYERLTQPVLDWFAGHDVPLLRINGEGSAETIHDELLKHLTLAA